ncbi:MAG TPA: acyl-CoA dehydrogenase family protein [Frankiaceae bacterium]|jgi:alkylation response protein AidB-like acyl-CoA dehydrogenase|nr:acyl-CoA dehydrogenase family protein [Frankiaceae bacterium]
MDVRFSAEQRALRESAGVLVERLRARSVHDLDDAERSRKLDAAVAASGWRELRSADDEGAPWASAVEVAIVAEELGRGAADTALLGPTLAAELRRLAHAPAAAGEETVALTPDLSALAVTGAPAVAADAAGAASALALVAGEGGYALAQVALAQVALAAGSDAAVDLTRSFLAVDLPASAPTIGDRLLTEDDLRRWNALGLAVTSADLVGVMDGAIGLACEYVGTRQQFGVAVGSFQAVQHLLADALVAMEGSRSVALHAAWAVDALAPDEALAAGAVAKAYCARAARRVSEAVIQVHGGIGNTWECFAHVYLRRALASSDVLGGVGANLERVLAHHAVYRRHDGRDH